MFDGMGTGEKFIMILIAVFLVAALIKGRGYNDRGGKGGGGGNSGGGPTQ